MPISKEKLREMRENSARKYAEQLRREEQQAKNYANERKKNMAKMMSAKERDAAVFKAAQEGVSISEISEKYGLTETRVKKIIAKTVGVVDAAELSEAERAELTAQAEADAGIYDNGSGENASDEPKPTDIGDIYDVARSVLGAMRSVNIPKGFDISFKIIGNSCKIDIANGDMALSSAMKWH